MTDETPSPDPATPAAVRRGILIAAIAGVVLFGLGVWLVVAKLPGFLSRSTAPETPSAAPKTATTGGGAEARRIMATLFFVSPDGMELVPVGREVLYGAT